MKVYLEDHMGPFTVDNVVKVEWVKVERFKWSREMETRMMIYTEDGKVRDKHIDDIVKIEGE